MSKLDEINEIGFIQHPDINTRMVLMTKDQKDWLISEIERLEKEKEWILKKYSELLFAYYPLYKKEYNKDSIKQHIVKEMQQALKEK